MTVGDALAGGSYVVTVGGEGVCGRFASSVSLHGECSRESSGERPSGSGVFVALDDDDAADAAVKLALRRNARKRQLLQLQYQHQYEHQQLRYWAQLEAGIKMALDQQYRVLAQQQKQLHHAVLASDV